MASRQPKPGKAPQPALQPALLAWPALRALLAMIFEAVNGQPPQTVLGIPADFVRQVMGKIGLQAREAGLNAMVERLKRAARQAAQENGEQPG